MNEEEDRQRLTYVEREVNAVKERVAAIEQGFYRVQESMTDLKETSRKETEQLQEAFRKLSEEEIKPLRQELRHYAQQSERAQGRRTVAGWVGWAIVVLLAAVAGAWVSTSPQADVPVVEQSGEQR